MNKKFLRMTLMVSAVVVTGAFAYAHSVSSNVVDNNNEGIIEYTTEPVAEMAGPVTNDDIAVLVLPGNNEEGIDEYAQEVVTKTVRVADADFSAPARGNNDEGISEYTF